VRDDDEIADGRPEATRPVVWERPREAPGLGLAIAVVVAVVALVARLRGKPADAAAAH